MTTPQKPIPLSEREPEFPCWLWHAGNHLMCPQWQHSSSLVQSLAVSPYTTHWLPDSPTAPKVVPETTKKLPDVAAKTLEILDAQDKLSGLSNWALVHQVLETEHADSLAVIELMNRVYPGWEMHDTEPVPASQPPANEEVKRLTTAAEQAKEALVAIKALVKDTLLPTINKAIKQGYKTETWAPEQFQWVEAACKVDDALAALSAALEKKEAP